MSVKTRTDPRATRLNRRFAGLARRPRCRRDDGDNSRSTDATTGLRSDYTVVLAAADSHHNYPDPLRRIHFYAAEQDRHLSLLTNSFDLPALTICLLYKARWQVELFFKWIKQHLRIKAFYGYSENAVKTPPTVTHGSVCHPVLDPFAEP